MKKLVVAEFAIEFFTHGAKYHIDIIEFSRVIRADFRDAISNHLPAPTFEFVSQDGIGYFPGDCPSPTISPGAIAGHLPYHPLT